MEKQSKITSGDASRLFHIAIEETKTKFGSSIESDIETLITSSLGNSTSGIKFVLEEKPEWDTTLDRLEQQIRSSVQQSHNRQDGVTYTFCVLKQVTDLPKATGSNRNSRQLGYILYPSHIR